MTPRVFSLRDEVCCLKRQLGAIRASVNNIEAEVEGVVESIPPVDNIVTDATTARTLGLTDAGKYIRFTNAGAITLTVPTNAVTVIPIGSDIVIRRHTGAGAITLSNAGVTVNNSALAPTVAAEGNFALKKIAADTWDVI